MKSIHSNLDPQIHKVAESIGEFIEYWGFKRVHGRIWSLIFLSEQPVDANYLIKHLNISKALVSMSLSELLRYEVIMKSPEKRSTVHFISNPNISEVISKVLLNREAKLLSQIENSCESLSKIDQDFISPHASREKINELKNMVCMANTTLSTFVALKSLNLTGIDKFLTR